MSVGPRGPLLLKDHVFQDEMAHFDRERIPERVVHAKGGGTTIHLRVFTIFYFMFEIYTNKCCKCISSCVVVN